MNYKAWKIKVADFYDQKSSQDKLKFLIGFAVLAPSSHNSQPWRFEIEENKIKVFADFSKRLDASDKDNRQLYISLGCSIENIKFAASCYGLQFQINYFPENNKELVAEIEFKNITGEHPKTELEEKINLIVKRNVNRNKYDKRGIDERFVDDIKKYSSVDVLIAVVSDQPRKNEIANVMQKAIKEALADQEFRSELSKYVKKNNTKDYYGMPGFGFGMPLPVSLLFPKIVKRIDISSVNSKQDSELIRKWTPAVCIISTKDNSELSWLKAGEMYEKIALDAEESGIRTAVMAAATQISDYYKDLQKIIGTNFRPQVFFRMGYTNKETPHSPRFTSEQVIK